MALPHMPFYGDRFYGSPRVARLSVEQECAYARLLWLSWQMDGLPNDPSGICAMLPRKISEAAILSTLKEFYVLGEDGRWRCDPQERVRDEVSEAQEKRAARSRNAAQRRWQKAHQERLARDAQAAGTDAPSIRPDAPSTAPGCSEQCSSTARAMPEQCLDDALYCDRDSDCESESDSGSDCENVTGLESGTGGENRSIGPSTDLTRPGTAEGSLFPTEAPDFERPPDAQPEPVERQPAPAERQKRGPSAAVVAVIEHYRRYHPAALRKPHAGTKVCRLIADRLAEGSTVEELCACIDGYHNSPYHLGENERNTRYLDLALFMRDAGKVQAGLEHARRNAPRAIDIRAHRMAQAIQEGIERRNGVHHAAE